MSKGPSTVGLMEDVWDHPSQRLDLQANNSPTRLSKQGGWYEPCQHALLPEQPHFHSQSNHILPFLLPPAFTLKSPLVLASSSGLIYML